MDRVPLLVLAGAMIAAVVIILTTGAALPADVAMHFGPRGAPDGWSSRDVYLAIMVAQVLLEPLLLLGAMVALPRRLPRLVNLPNRDYWLAAPRRDAALRRFGTFAAVLGLVVIVFLTALHLVVVRANMAAAPALPLEPFIAVVAAFIIAIGAWAARLRSAFRTAP